MVALSIILLMTPAAYHRIVDEGEDTDRFHRFASRIMLAAMIPLAIGISGDFFVVLRKVTGSLSFATAGAAGTLILFLAFWFGFSWLKRGQVKRETARAWKAQPG